MKPPLQVVWFKRDLRCEDHAALAAASRLGPVLALYIVEPDYWALPDTSLRQWQFVRDSLLDVDHALRERSGLGLQVVVGEVLAVLTAIRRDCGPFTLHSHEETGNFWTYQRDQRVAGWCRAQGISWQQYAQFGVRRPNCSRDDWADFWQAFVSAPCAPALPRWQGMAWTGALPRHTWPQWPGPLASLGNCACPGRQAGGRKQGLAVLASFLAERGRWYRGSLSVTTQAAQHGSRLSSYLAYGCISLREVVQAVRAAQGQVTEPRWQASLAAFESRLWWHCHFIQKLEDEPEQEWRELHPAWREQREANPQWFAAWAAGRTGWPLVDASMRYLQHHGWLNFRMRAMLVSVASYPLWLPWQAPAAHLARLFVDYEPGIHYPQVQMQAGTTGINVPRQYNPTLQAQRLDPHGQFIRRWVPELSRYPSGWLHEPWRMPAQQRLRYQTEQAYPEPLVDLTQAQSLARERMQALRDTGFKQEARRIGERHGSRRRSERAGRAAQRAEVASAQLSLFAGTD